MDKPDGITTPHSLEDIMKLVRDHKELSMSWASIWRIDLIKLANELERVHQLEDFMIRWRDEEDINEEYKILDEVFDWMKENPRPDA